jgi:protocatechuate 3,4-dioxygenase beta subunit
MVVSRRDAMKFLGAASVSYIAIGRPGRLLAQSCAVTPPETIGPYWVDEMLERADVRVDPSDGSVSPGVPLRLVINVLRGDDNCAPADGLQVDIWHCDTGGLYSDEAANGTVGRKFLRGYQVTDANGSVTFLTIYPGWYSGRTIHVHFRIRTLDGATTAYDFASQLYFDDAISDAVLSESPYNARGARNTTNADDTIFVPATLMTVVSDGSGGYQGSFDVALNGLPAGTATPEATASPTPTASPSVNPTVTPGSRCSGDCNGDGQVSVDELVTLVDSALGGAQPSACPMGLPDDGELDIAFLVDAVGKALNGCG